jgi:hypothetical protein
MTPTRLRFGGCNEETTPCPEVDGGWERNTLVKVSAVRCL